MKRFCLALDLKNDPVLIGEYKRHHEKIWPEITDHIYEAGVLDMEIYHVGDRLFMIMETEDDFTFEKMDALAANNKKVEDWESLMWKFQKPLEGVESGEKWKLMERIFKL